jgi:endogenous inhibitor of DNA gyrase (YacG/DUF329 family)
MPEMPEMPETQPCPICESPVPVVQSLEQAPAVTGAEPPPDATTLYSKCPRCETHLEREIAPDARWVVSETSAAPS